MTPLVLERTVIAGPAGSLEAVIEETGVASAHYAVLCHPHPLFGGTMDNKVVVTAARALQEVGIPTLRFNFRGVAGSQGVFDAGRGETADAAAAATAGATRWPRRALMLAGFSFGAFVALRLTQQRPTSRLILIAPPIAMFDFSDLRAPDCPWLVIQGDADDVIEPQRVADWVGGMRPQPKFVPVRSAGHFFHGRLHELRDAIYQSVRGG